MPSYHDLYVTTAKIPRTRLFDLSHIYEVTCHRCTGWALCENGRIIAGEYGYTGLCLDIAGEVICNSLEMVENE